MNYQGISIIFTIKCDNIHSEVLVSRAGLAAVIDRHYCGIETRQRHHRARERYYLFILENKKIFTL